MADEPVVAPVVAPVVDPAAAPAIPETGIPASAAPKIEAPKVEPALEPIVYTAFKLPEGIKLDEAGLAEMAPIFQDARVSQENAQKLLDLHVKVSQAGQKANADAWAASKLAWQNELKADPEFGQAKLQETTSLAAKAIDAYGGKDAPVLREFMKVYGLGDHPAFARFLARAGRSVAEDALPRANGAGQTNLTAQDLYPNSTMNP